MQLEQLEPTCKWRTHEQLTDSQIRKSYKRGAVKISPNDSVINHFGKWASQKSSYRQ